MEKYSGLKTIGDGTYGSVVKAMNMKTGEIVAIKKMKKKYYKWDSCISLREILSLMKLHHPNIVQLYEVILEKNVLHFVFEYLDLNVYQLMKDRKRLFSEHQIRNIMFQTLQGLAYMHKNNYFHRDLKPENLLCYHQTIKIADFGLAKEMNARPPFTDYVSTRWYRAPEILLRAPDYNAPIDIFAMGAIMSELFTMRPLFPGQSEADQMNQICKVLGTPSRLQWPEGHKLAQQLGFKFPQYLPQSLSGIIQNASEDAIKLITDMLHYDPKKRPTASQCLLNYSFFQVKLPIPMSAPDFDEQKQIQDLLDDTDDNEPTQRQITQDQQQKLYQSKKRQELLQMNAQQQNSQAPGKKVSSMQMMRRCRYKAGVNTKCVVGMENEVNQQ